MAGKFCLSIRIMSSRNFWKNFDNIFLQRVNNPKLLDPTTECKNCKVSKLNFIIL